MIAHINGTIAEKFPPSSIIVDVNGVGYEVNLTTLDFENANLDDKTKFYTYHSIR
ncbi:Holliday junction branch migration protein RuvA, partial [Candidatus Saccharibacteria bacterium]|nr:Holliday junction branch migration protein RuvA [Candidatus Saccharibacteria bacterium]